MLVKQSSSFSRKHRILSLEICVRQTVWMTRKPDDYRIWRLMQRQAYHKTSKLLCACMKAKGHQFEHLLNLNRLFSEPPTVYWGKHVISRPFNRSYSKANKIRKSERIRKVEYAYHFWNCAGAVTQKLSKLVHACWNYLPKLARFFETHCRATTTTITSRVTVTVALPNVNVVGR